MALKNIFNKQRNYRFIFEKYPFYISPIAYTLAYCLMPNNHFHVLIKSEEVRLTYHKLTDKKSHKSYDKFGSEKIISKQLSKFFSCYTQLFNKVYYQRSHLFVSNYKQKEITSKASLMQVFIYIHYKLIKHVFIKKPNECFFSSNTAYIFEKEKFINKNHFLNNFETVELVKAACKDNLLLSDDLILKN